MTRKRRKRQFDFVNTADGTRGGTNRDALARLLRHGRRSGKPPIRIGRGRSAGYVVGSVIAYPK